MFNFVLGVFCIFAIFGLEIKQTRLCYLTWHDDQLPFVDMKAFSSFLASESKFQQLRISQLKDQ